MFVFRKWLIGHSIGKTELQRWMDNYNDETSFSCIVTRFAPALYRKTLVCNNLTHLVR